MPISSPPRVAAVRPVRVVVRALARVGPAVRRLAPLAALLPALALAALAIWQVSHLGREVAEPRPTPGLLIGGRTEVANALMTVVAPLPLALAIGLRRRRRPADAADRAVGVALTWLLCQSALFALACSAGMARPRPWLMGQAGLLAVGLTAFAWRWRANRDRDELRATGLAYLLVGLALAGGGWLSVRLGQPCDWDLKSYHYYNAHSLLTGRFDTDLAAAGRETYFNPLGDVPFYLLERSVRPVWVGFVLGAVHLVPGVLLFALSYKLLMAAGCLPRWRSAGALFCTVVGLCEPTCVVELGMTANDNLLAGLVIAALLAVVRATESRQPAAWLLLGGALVGCGVGLKLTVAPCAVALTLAVPVLAPGLVRKAGYPVLFGAGAAFGFLLTDGYWLLRMLEKFGNPVFPWFNELFRSKAYYPTKLGVWGGAPETIREKLLQPFDFLTVSRKAMEVPIADRRLAVAFVLLAAGALAAAVGAFLRPVRTATRPVTAFLAVFCVTAFVVWQAKFHVYRYLCAVNMVVPLLCVLLLHRICRGREGAVAVLALAVGVGVVDGLKVGNTYGRKVWTPTYFDLRPTRLFVEPDALVLFTPMQSDTLEVPMTHVTTLLWPETARVLNVGSYFLSPGLTMGEEARLLIRTHPGPLYLLAHEHGMPHAIVRMQQRGLWVQWYPYEPIRGPWLAAGLYRLRRGGVSVPGVLSMGYAGRIEGTTRVVEAGEKPGYLLKLPLSPAAPNQDFQVTVRYRSGPGAPSVAAVTIGDWPVVADELPPAPDGGTWVARCRLPVPLPGQVWAHAVHRGAGLTVESVSIGPPDPPP